MKLYVSHSTVYRYDGGARVSMLLKLKPRSHEAQSIEQWSVTVNGAPVDTFLVNGAGDLEALWTSGDRVDSATIVASGIVRTKDLAGVMRGLPIGPSPLVYVRETPLTEMSDEMTAFLKGLGGGDTLAQLHELMAKVRESIDYEGGQTVAETPAAEAFALGKGVCQDHAHIFITLARALNIPARYVSGYMMAADDAEELHETHAWAEALVPDIGWIGFDVANKMCVTDRYIRLASGLDAHDAAPIRGSATTLGAIHIDADVRIDQSGQAQSAVQNRQTQSQSGVLQSQGQKQQ